MQIVLRSIHWLESYSCLKFPKKHRFWSVPGPQSQFASAADRLSKWVTLTVYK